MAAPGRNPTATRNGWYDSGRPLRDGAKQCPSCGSANFVESLSREKCNSCGLECDYWGSGANAVYEAYIERTHAAEKREREERWRKEEEEEQAAYEAMNNPLPPWYDD